jgi:hypothetical protein
LCDRPQLISNIKPLLRNHVTFTDSSAQSEFEIANLFKEYILRQNAIYDRYKATAIKTAENGATFSFSWYEDNYHEVYCNRIELSVDWHVFHRPSGGVPASYAISLMIDEWLRSNSRFENIKWYAAKSWAKSIAQWQTTPI